MLFISCSPLKILITANTRVTTVISSSLLSVCLSSHMFTNRETEGLLGSLPRVVTHGFKRQIHICPCITFSTTRVQCLWCRIYLSSKGQHMEKTDFLHFYFFIFYFLKEIFMNLFNWWYFVLITQHWFNSQSISKTHKLTNRSHRK